MFATVTGWSCEHCCFLGSLVASPLATRSRDWSQAEAVQRIHQFGSTWGIVPTPLVASSLWTGACWWASGGQISLCGNNKEPTPFGPVACWDRYRGQLQCFQVVANGRVPQCASSRHHLEGERPQDEGFLSFCPETFSQDPCWHTQRSCRA